MKTRFCSLWKAVETGAILQQSPPPEPAKRGSLSGGQFVLLAALFAILIMTIVWAITVWTSSNDVPMSKHGWIALGLGTVFSLVIGCGLMALMFFSSRSGHDEVATPKVHEAWNDARQKLRSPSPSAPEHNWVRWRWSISYTLTLPLGLNPG